MGGREAVLKRSANTEPRTAQSRRAQVLVVVPDY